MKIANGMKVKVNSGRHKGRSGTVQDLNKTPAGTITITVVEESGERFKTLAKNVELASS